MDVFSIAYAFLLNGVIPYLFPNPVVYKDRDNVIADVQIRFYTGPTFNDFKIYKLIDSVQLLDNPAFNKSANSIIYVHGFTEYPTDPSTKTIITAYLKAEPKSNKILIDWSNMAAGSFITNASPNVQNVANELTAQLRRLIDRGLNLTGIHLIGHSLGAHVIGFTGRELKQYGIKIKRITALDAAFPVFYQSTEHIEPTDAEVVEIIHTNGWMFGAPFITGSIDYWPNGGMLLQPGCPQFPFELLSNESLCSHRRSWRFWSEAVLNPSAFPAVKARTYQAFLRENDRPDPNRAVVYMGPKADQTARGDYYLITNSMEPFGRGMNGTYSIP